MKTTATQQEILLMTGTSFSNRQCHDNTDMEKARNLTEKEKLEEACWNGLLKDMLPEVFKEIDSQKELYLWQVKEATSFLELDLAEFPDEKDNYLSLDPYAFMPLQFFS
jgi:hypothetical protein